MTLYCFSKVSMLNGADKIKMDECKVCVVCPYSSELERVIRSYFAETTEKLWKII